MSFTRDQVLNAVVALLEHRYEVRAVRNKRFRWRDGTVLADLYFPAPLNCIVQFDDETHCSRERAATIRRYPAGVPLNFDVRRYLLDDLPGKKTTAAADARADRLPPKHGLNPTVRIRHDELTELSGTLTERLAALLQKRFAVHAGTTFHLMLENAGAKPHRTVGS